jgi:hypothetical protein
MRFAGAFLPPKHAALEELSATLNLNGYARVKAEMGHLHPGVDPPRSRPWDRVQGTLPLTMVQVSGPGWRTPEPVEVGIEKPARMWALLTRRCGPTPYLPASTELGAAPEFLETWIPPRHRQPGATAGGGGGSAWVMMLAPR